MSPAIKLIENKHNWTLGENKPNQSQFQTESPDVVALEGRKGVMLWAVSAGDGKKLSGTNLTN